MTLLPRWWRVHFLWVELSLVLIVLSCFTVYVEHSGRRYLLDATLAGNRNAIYGTLASIFGSLLGFVITAVSIVLGYATSDQLRVVRESKHYPTLWRTFTAAIRCLGSATLVAVVGVIFDREDSPQHWITYICMFTSTLTIARLVRSVWILENVVWLVTSPTPKQKSLDS
jgi:carbon starvation protein CstA